MPYAKSHHCFVRVSFHLAILAGGWHHDQATWKQSLLYDIDAQVWSMSAGGSIQVARVMSACGLIKDQSTGNIQVVMAGGLDPADFSTPLVETELWTPNGNPGGNPVWKLDLSAHLPWAIWRAATASAPDFSALYITGGFLL